MGDLDKDMRVKIFKQMLKEYNENMVWIHLAKNRILCTLISLRLLASHKGLWSVELAQRMGMS